jgi:hypothetical protein
MPESRNSAVREGPRREPLLGFGDILLLVFSISYMMIARGFEIETILQSFRMLRFEVLMSVNSKNKVFFGVTPCSLVEGYKYLGRNFCLHIHDTLKMEADAIYPARLKMQPNQSFVLFLLVEFLSFILH